MRELVVSCVEDEDVVNGLNVILWDVESGQEFKLRCPTMEDVDQLMLALINHTSETIRTK